MEVDGKLRDSKMKTVSVGGLPRPDGKIQHGFRGCIQVRPLSQSHLCLHLCLLYTTDFPIATVIKMRKLRVYNNNVITSFQ